MRTVDEAKKVIELLAQNGTKRGENGLMIIMMCEIPSNAILADEFLEHFDGFSIGSNDMTQMTLALDRDSGLIAEGFDERDPAVKHMLHLAIQACRKAGKYVGICGQGHRIIRILRSGSWRRALAACRSFPTPWSKRGSTSRVKSRKPRQPDKAGCRAVRISLSVRAELR